MIRRSSVHRSLRSLLAATALFALPAAAAPAFAPHPIAATGQAFDFHSAIRGRDYRVFLRIPGGTPPPGGFPVIYLLDGNWYFQTMADAAGLQAATGEAPRVIVVGIGYPLDGAGAVNTLRVADLALPARPEAMPPALRGQPTDGAEAFYRVLTEEVAPFVEAQVPVNRACQTLFGHSLGATFALHVLFTHPEAFRNVVAASPAIWWGENRVLADEAAFEARLARGAPSPRLLMTIGERERRTTPVPAGQIDGKMVDNMLALSARLAPYRAKGFEFTSEVLPGESHNSSVPGVISQALRFGTCP